MDTPEVKMLMRHRTKSQLVQLAKDFKVLEGGTKRQLAVRVAEAQERERMRTWDVIVGTRRE